MKTAPTFAALVVLVSVTGCADTARLPAQPSTVSSTVSSPPTPVPPPQGGPTWTTGSFTWTGIDASRPICSELTSQVGQSWSLSLGVQRDGDSVTLLLAEGAPPNPHDPLADPPETFVGSLKGDTISASIEGPAFGMSCPNDSGITRETGGALTAVVAGTQVSGTYTEVYGSGAEQVTFTYGFHAGWPSSAAGWR